MSTPVSRLTTPEPVPAPAADAGTPLRVAFVAVSYVARRDGVSVYAENLLLEMLRQAPRRGLEVDVFVCGRAAAVLADVLRRAGLADRVRLFALAADGPLDKYLRVPLRVRSCGSYHCVFVPNLQPLWLPAGRTVGVLHDLTYQVARSYFPRWRARYMDLLTRFWLWRGMTVACISRTTVRDLERFYPSSHGRPRPYLPNGLPTKLTAAPRPAREAAEARLATAPLELIFVGRLNRLKGVDRVRHVCLGLDEYCAAWGIEATVHVVGKDTPESAELLAGCERLPRVRLVRHGYLDDRALNALYRRCGFCLLLSRNEGFGLPLLEAIWQRCVPLLSDIAVFREIMGAGYPLFAGDPESIAALADFIRRVRVDPAYRGRILADMDRALATWEGGYTQAARTLLAWAAGEAEATGEQP